VVADNGLKQQRRAVVVGRKRPRGAATMEAMAMGRCSNQRVVSGHGWPQWKLGGEMKIEQKLERATSSKLVAAGS